MCEKLRSQHCVSGRCYTKDVLIGLMRLAEKHKIHFISDEVYALSTFDNGEDQSTPFTSVLSINRTGLISDDRLQVFYGMSKVFSFSPCLTFVFFSENPTHWSLRISAQQAWNSAALSLKTHCWKMPYCQIHGSITHQVCLLLLQQRSSKIASSCHHSLCFVGKVYEMRTYIQLEVLTKLEFNIGKEGECRT